MIQSGLDKENNHICIIWKYERMHCKKRMEWSGCLLFSLISAKYRSILKRMSKDRYLEKKNKQTNKYTNKQNGEVSKKYLTS